jgi:proteic killer suppression protein
MSVARRVTITVLIRSFRHKGLEELHRSGKGAKLPAELRKRCERILDALDEAENLNDLAIPGFGTHPLEGSARYAISVNGPWRITFEFTAPDAWRVDLEQYH